jgi:hypothetical protein
MPATNPQDQALYTEISTDPLARGYAGMSNTALYTSLYVTKDRTVTGPRSPYKLADIFGWNSLRDWNASVDPGAKLGWTLFLAALQNDQKIDMAGGPIYSRVLNEARSATPAIITAAEKTAAIALCTSLESRATELGLPLRYPLDLGIIRA